PQSTGFIKANGKRTLGQRFQRVDPAKVVNDIVMDNRYEAKTGPQNDYGQKAHQDLIVTRGAGFRKEKNKKKRGSYKGGEITMQAHSFKFTD
ncbi:SRP40, C-terminal domain-containing protein, partial [Cyathus striatus]